MEWVGQDTIHLGTFDGATWSFRINFIFNTPIKSDQKWFYRVVLVEKSSLVLDICWMNVPFDVMSFQKHLRFFFNECCENTLKIKV